MPLIITSGLGATGSAADPAVDSITSYESYLLVVFNTSLDVSSNVLRTDSWSVSGGGRPVSVRDVSMHSASTIRIDVTEQTDGETYVLHFPEVGILTLFGEKFYGPFEENFVGAGSGPSILMVRTVDARTLEVFFNEAVNPGDALNSANYSIDNGLQVVSVTKVTPVQYLITTSKQVEGISYTVTASNIRDEQLNSA